MKKYLLLFMAGVFSLFLFSCSDDRNDTYVDGTDTYPVVLDIKNVNFSYTAENGHHIMREFQTPLVPQDVVLIYRQAGSTNDGSPVWQQIPRTLYLDGGNEFDYDFDFSRHDIWIYANGNYDITTTPELLTNQTFRVVLVPASQGGKSAVDTSDYNSVIRHYNIDDSKVVNL